MYICIIIIIQIEIRHENSSTHGCILQLRERNIANVTNLLVELAKTPYGLSMESKNRMIAICRHKLHFAVFYKTSHFRSIRM